MIKDCITTITNRKTIDKILSYHKCNNYFQCLKCGSIKSDSKDLARTLYPFAQKAFEYYDKEEGDYDEEYEAFKEECYYLLTSLLFWLWPEDGLRDNDILFKWFEENEPYLMHEFDMGFEYEDVYIASKEVIVKTSDDCGCSLSLFQEEDDDD
ncbi:MAG: hypothetical protein ABIA04_00470 [Pseudomonadota bacterium]